MPTLPLPAAPLKEDLGKVSVHSARTIELENCLHKSQSFVPLREAAPAFSFVPGRPIVSKTAIINEWSVTCVVTSTNIYLFIPTHRQWNSQVSIERQDGSETTSFDNAVRFADITFYQHQVYIVSDSNDTLRIDLTSISGDSLAVQQFYAVPVVEAPRARIIQTVDRFLVVGHTQRPTEAVPNPSRIRWSGINAPLEWTLRDEEATGTGSLTGDQWYADIQDVVGIAAQERDMIVFGKNNISLGKFTGDRFVFRFDTLSDIGIVSAQAHATLGSTTYFFSSQGFFSIASGAKGVELNPIGVNIINDSVLGRVNWHAIEQVVATVDETITCIVWSLPVDGSAANNLLVFYNYLEGTWSTADVPVAAFLRYAAPAVNIEGERSFDNLFGGLNNIPFGFHSQVWAGNYGSEIGFISSEETHDNGESGDLTGFKFTALNGDEHLQATIKYPTFQFDREHRTQVEYVQLVSEGRAQGILFHRHGDRVSALQEQSYALPPDGVIDLDASNSIYHQLELQLDSFQRIKALNVNFKPTGMIQ